MEDDNREVHHPQIRPQDRHDHERRLLHVPVSQVDADLPDVHRDVDDVVEDHDAHSDDLDVENEAEADHHDRDHVVAEEDDPIWVRPEEPDIDQIIGDVQHEVDLLEAGEEARGRLHEVLAAVRSPEDAVAIRAAVERDAPEDAG